MLPATRSVAGPSMMYAPCALLCSTSVYHSLCCQRAATSSALSYTACSHPLHPSYIIHTHCRSRLLCQWREQPVVPESSASFLNFHCIQMHRKFLPDQARPGVTPRVAQVDDEGQVAIVHGDAREVDDAGDALLYKCNAGQSPLLLADLRRETGEGEPWSLRRTRAKPLRKDSSVSV